MFTTREQKQPQPSDEKAETMFTFQGAKRQNFVDEDGHTIKEPTPNTALSSPPPAAPQQAPPPPLDTGGPIDLSAPVPRTKTIPPPRNHILTKHAFKATAATPADRPGALCGFSASLVQTAPEAPAAMFLFGGADESTLLGEAYLLHINASRWERVVTGGGGPGALFGHSASVLGGKIWFFGGLTYTTTFDFMPSPSPNAGAIAPAASPSPITAHLQPTKSAEEEDEEAHRRLAAARLQARLSGLSVQRPPPADITGAAALLASQSGSALPSSATSSPKLVDAAGSPGGGVGHEEEDADKSVETHGLSEGPNGKSKAGGVAWRVAAATGSGLWKVAKLPWKATKASGKGLKKLGSGVLSTVLGTETKPKTKAEIYGVDKEPPESGNIDLDGQKVHVQLGPGSARNNGGYSSTGTPQSATVGSSSSAKAAAGYTRASNSSRRLTSLGMGSTRAEVPSASLYAFDPITNAWANELDVRGLAPEGRYMHSACAFPETNCIYVFGGCKSRGYLQSSNDLHKLDLRSMSWSVVPPRGRFPCKRHGHSATNIGHGHMLVFGGQNEDPDPRRKLDPSFEAEVRRFNDTYIFDTASETWHAITTYGSAPAPRAFHMAELIADRYLYVLSGETAGDSTDCCILDLNHMVWSRPLFDGCFSMEMHGGIALSSNGKLLVYGGLDAALGCSSDCFLLNTIEVVGQNDSYTEFQLKILVVGGKGVGKTSLVRRFVEDRFSSKVEPLGVPYRTCLTLIQGKLVKLHLWDVDSAVTLAQMQRDKLVEGVDAAVLVYDQSDPESIENLEVWSEQIHAANATTWKDGLSTAATVASPQGAKRGSSFPSRSPQSSPSAPSSTGDDDDDGSSPSGMPSSSRVRLCVVANKCDLAARLRVVSGDAGRNLASRVGGSFVESSAKDCTGVDATFLNLARLLVKDRLAGRHGAQGACLIC